MHATSILHAQATLGEGALWNPEMERLYWVDIEGKEFHVFDPATGHDRCYPVGSCIGTAVPMHGGHALVALQSGIHKIDLNTGQLTLLANPVADADQRFNDGKCDPAGRFWVGTLDLKQRDRTATLYRFDPDGSTHVMLRHVTNSNGLVWSPDRRTMYYIDTATQAVQAFDYDDATGSIDNPRVIIRIGEKTDGEPDGMTIDVEGKLWIALFGAGQVRRYDPETGALLQTIHVPAPNTSSCAFGGPELKTLFITTGRGGLTAQQQREFPLSGNLFAVEPGMAGVPAYFFGQG
ncbi:SMP-30/gluconolactonase/LRE family protein [Hymenobacter properus]|uniref:SMP-30/gluconolactonase/LRE family protein n=1 Tax=Hymenobacter properus TaxID=2791026 RepID=A0A931FKY9_9BACT|nr:SMP-30/gluconolactonase/LRE family protein [Hymenobacter properus]MBF9143593.1 SMP-30/gluconolactonase/LRE family protein [Hymenobacter properus]MBR7722406.1 SMP-30/gluconolactonase/LRE family protein [Microvirga sp. SRT04]